MKHPDEAEGVITIGGPTETCPRNKNWKSSWPSFERSWRPRKENCVPPRQSWLSSSKLTRKVMSTGRGAWSGWLDRRMRPSKSCGASWTRWKLRQSFIAAERKRDSGSLLAKPTSER